MTRPTRVALALLSTLSFGVLALPALANSDAGASTYGCVESIPKGGQRPVLIDVFPTRGTSGWAAILSITIRHGKGERVLPSGLDLSANVEAKKVLEQAGFAIPEQDAGAAAKLWTEPDDPQKTEQTTHFELPIVLLPPNAGRSMMTLPPLPVAVARANGEIATACTKEHVIVVDDPTANTPEAMPKPNPPGIVQREEWTALKRALSWLAVGLVLGAIALWLVRRWLSRPKPVPPPPPPRPAWDIALDELEAIRRDRLLEKERYTEYFDRTNDALRRYLGNRFGFDGIESTTDEVLAQLMRHSAGFVRFDAPGASAESGLPAPGVSFDVIARFLRESDLVKFANLTPTPEACLASLATGESIVRGTMPLASAKPSPSAGATTASAKPDGESAP
jgi:hypothetical protein